MQKELERKRGNSTGGEPLLHHDGSLNKTPTASPTNKATGSKIIDGDLPKAPAHGRGSINSEHEEFLHPNMMRESMVDERQSARARRKQFGSCKNCFRRFDEWILRPLLIYNYDKELVHKKDEFMELFLNEAEVWEKLYVKEEYKPDEVDDARSQRGHQVFQRITTLAKRNSVHNSRS